MYKGSEKTQQKPANRAGLTVISRFNSKVANVSVACYTCYLKCDRCIYKVLQITQTNTCHFMNVAYREQSISCLVVVAVLCTYAAFSNFSVTWLQLDRTQWLCASAFLTIFSLVGGPNLWPSDLIMTKIAEPPVTHWNQFKAILTECSLLAKLAAILTISGLDVTLVLTSFCPQSHNHQHSTSKLIQTIST